MLTFFLLGTLIFVQLNSPLSWFDPPLLWKNLTDSAAEVQRITSWDETTDTNQAVFLPGFRESGSKFLPGNKDLHLLEAWMIS